MAVEPHCGEFAARLVKDGRVRQLGLFAPAHQQHVGAPIDDQFDRSLSNGRRNGRRTRKLDVVREPTAKAAAGATRHHAHAVQRTAQNTRNLTGKN